MPTDHASGGRLRVVILISGNGSNLQAIIDAVADHRLHVQIAAVISNRADAGGLERARRAGLHTAVVDHRSHPDRASFDGALREAIDAHRPELVVLAGFMRILTGPFVDHYRGRMLNIHPSLLPQFRGLDTHARALAAGVEEHGASVHFVTSELDGGPVVAQVRVPVESGDTAQDLAARVLEQEHRLYPLVIEWFAQNRLQLRNDGKLSLDGRELRVPCRLQGDSGEIIQCG